MSVVALVVAAVLVLALLVGGGVLLAVVLSSRSDSGVASDRVELARMRELVADLKDIAYDHRELDSALATILVDRIRTYERQQRDEP
jgi:hypothetical protein